MGNTGVGGSTAYGLSPMEREFNEATGLFNVIFHPNPDVRDQVTGEVIDQVAESQGKLQQRL